MSQEQDDGYELPQSLGGYIAAEIHITDEGVAVVESGLSVRQAHEIKTGCSPNALCDECRRAIGEDEQ